MFLYYVIFILTFVNPSCHLSSYLLYFIIFVLLVFGGNIGQNVIDNNNNTNINNNIEFINQYNPINLDIRTINTNIIKKGINKYHPIIFVEVTKVNHIFNDFISITIKLYNYSGEYIIAGNNNKVTYNIGSRFFIINYKYNKIVDINKINIIDIHYNSAYISDLKTLDQNYYVCINGIKFNNLLYKKLYYKKIRNNITESELGLFFSIRHIINNKNINNNNQNNNNSFNINMHTDYDRLYFFRYFNTFFTFLYSLFIFLTFYILLFIFFLFFF